MRRTSVRYSLDDSLGSLSELDTQIEIAFRLGYLKKEEYETIEEELIEIQKLFSGLSRSLN